MRTLHITRKDWLSDEELWLAIPAGAITRQCLTHVPRHSWKKLMVEFFLALNTNVGSWIHNLEIRDMMLLGSLTENIFGFAGTYARKQQARLAPILTGWKMDGIQHNEHRKETLRQLAYEPQDCGFHLHQHRGKSSIMECGSPWIPKG